jgi:hypothetical protein
MPRPRRRINLPRLTHSNHQAASKSGTAAGLPHQRRCGIVWLKARETLVLERREFTLLIDVAMAQPGVRARGSHRLPVIGFLGTRSSANLV